MSQARPEIAKTYTVHSLERGLSVLRAVRNADGPVRNQDIVARTGLPKATVSRLTHTLTAIGYLRRIDQGSYVPGEASGRPGRAMLDAMRLERFGPVLQPIMSEDGAFACLQARIADHMVPVYRWSADAAVPLASGVCADLASDESLAMSCHQFHVGGVSGNCDGEPAASPILQQLARTGWCHSWSADVARLDACTGINLQAGGSFVLSVHLVQRAPPSRRRLERVSTYLVQAAAAMDGQPG